MSFLKQHSVLIASPLLNSHSLYKQGVIFLLQSTKKHTGILINQFSPLTIKKLLSQIGLSPKNYTGKQKTLMFGGTSHLQTIYSLTKQHSIYHFKPVNILQLAHPSQKKNTVMFQGVTQWELGQLEQEIYEGLWLNSKLQPDLLFKTPVKHRYQSALSHLSIHPSLYQKEIGHG